VNDQPLRTHKGVNLASEAHTIKPLPNFSILDVYLGKLDALLGKLLPNPSLCYCPDGGHDDIHILQPSISLDTGFPTIGLPSVAVHNRGIKK
jgi:hypothetical protein